MSLTKVSYSMIQNAPVNIVDYGAVGNGIIDDSAAFQTAIDNLSAAGGGTIDLGNKIYVVKEIVCKSNVNFVGQNATILRPENTPNSTRLIYVGSDKAGGTSLTTLIENVSFSGITFNGNIANQINSAADYNPITDTIAFNGAYEQNHSVYVGAESTGSVGCKNVRFTNCTFNGSQGDGIAINTYAQNVYVTNMYGRACARGSLDMFGGSSTVFVDGLKADDYVHIEVDIPIAFSPSTCTMANSIMADLAVNGIYQANSLRVYFVNCVINAGPTFFQAGGYVTNCTFNIGLAGGTASHRIIRSENLVFQSCNFLGLATLLTGPLVSLEPSAGETESQLLTFDGCNFEALVGSQTVTGIQETVTWHAPGSQYLVRNCRFRNLFAAIDVKQNGVWYAENNLYFLCNAAYAWRRYLTNTVERFTSKNNSWQECNYYGYFDENSNVIGSTSYLYDTDWIHSFIVFPQFEAPGSFTLVQSVNDRRQFYALASDFSTSTSVGTPFAWKGCRVWITDSDTTGDPVLYYKVTNYPSPAYPPGRDWDLLVTIP